jgi:glycosyltransferase involved in cell wall biosynthesis
VRKPLVSIITPSYNQCQYIEDCLLSVKNQTYENIEHIIMDACSTDETNIILRKYEDTYNIKIYIEPDNGPADALNKGFSKAKGDILCWLNSDDYYLHGKVIQTIVTYFELYEKASIVTGCGFMVDNKGKWITPKVIDHRRITKKHIKYSDGVLQPSTFWKKDVHVALDDRLQYVFDWVLFINMLVDGANILVANDYFTAYRIHEKSRTAYDNADRKKEIALVLKDNFGFVSTQYFWGLIIYYLYRFSELTKFNYIKKIAIFSNMVINKLSSGKITSC